MRSLACTIVACSLLAFAAPVGAQGAAPVPASEATPAPHRVRLEYGGRQGWWFSEEHTKLILADLLTVEELKKQIGLLDERVQKSDQKSEDQKTALQLSEASEALAVEALAKATKRAREAEEAEDDLFAGQPLIWAIGGTLVGVAGTALVVALVSK